MEETPAQKRSKSMKHFLSQLTEEERQVWHQKRLEGRKRTNMLLKRLKETARELGKKL